MSDSFRVNGVYISPTLLFGKSALQPGSHAPLRVVQSLKVHCASTEIVELKGRSPLEKGKSELEENLLSISPTKKITRSPFVNHSPASKSVRTRTTRSRSVVDSLSSK